MAGPSRTGRRGQDCTWLAAAPFLPGGSSRALGESRRGGGPQEGGRARLGDNSRSASSPHCQHPGLAPSLASACCEFAASKHFRSSVLVSSRHSFSCAA